MVLLKYYSMVKGPSENLLGHVFILEGAFFFTDDLKE